MSGWFTRCCWTPACKCLGGIEEYPREVTRLPVGVRRLRLVSRPTASSLWCYVRVAQPMQSTPGRWSVDTWLFEAPGRTIAAFTGLEFHDVPRDVLSEALRKLDPSFGEVGSPISVGTGVGTVREDWLFRPAWIPQPRSGDSVPHRAASDDPWLVLADEGGVGDRLATLLGERGERCVLVRRGDCFESEGDNLCRVNPQHGDHFLRLVEITRADSATGYRGAVHLWKPGPRVGQLRV